MLQLEVLLVWVQRVIPINYLLIRIIECYGILKAGLAVLCIAHAVTHPEFFTQVADIKGFAETFSFFLHFHLLLPPNSLSSQELVLTEYWAISKCSIRTVWLKMARIADPIFQCTTASGRG